jgi:hypothetical protein
LLFAAVPAGATLTYDLRVVGGGKNGVVAYVDDFVRLELYAVVTGASGNAAAEGFQDGWVSVRSSSGGNIQGNLTGLLTSPFGASGSQNGASQDLDGDGDKDLGSTSAFSATPNPDGSYVYARAATMQTTGVTIPNGQEFKIADLLFVVTGLTNPNDFSPISLNVFVAQFSNSLDIEAVWMEDGVGSAMNLNPGGTFPNSFPAVGTAVTVAIPEPSSAMLMAGGILLFSGYRRRRAPRQRG